ncbi:cytochrome P450 3A28-like [Physella acuta]|uniref:cytochrome P450 3A28-like n=1 Tax=Physella acuta TaxID=109671 RepID=UPI0027DBC8F2|nr:cytochrome P450 3A28-like [Physella acuta]
MVLLTMQLVFGTAVAVVVCVLVWWFRYIKSHYTVFTKLGIPGPKPTFLFGNALAFANKFPMDVFKDWTKEYGHVYGFYEGLRPSVVVSCPDMAHKILVKHFNQFSVRPVINPFKHEHQELSLQNVSGQLWKRQRQAVSAGLTARCARQMYPTINHVTNQLMTWFEGAIERSPNGFYIDDIMERYSLDWFAQASLGYHSDAMTNENNVLLRYMRASHQSMSPDNAIGGLAKLFPILSTWLKPFDKHHREMSRLQTRDVTRFIRSIQENISDFKTSSCDNIIHSLLTKRVASANSNNDLDPPRETKNKSVLQETEIVGEVSGLLGGGVGPIAAALTLCIYNLAVYEEEQMRLREEVEAVTSSKNEVTMDELCQLTVMDRYINETLRLYPVAPGVSRECVEDCTINNVTFTKGMVVRVMMSTINSREDIFPEPSRFNPDRFIISEDDEGATDTSLPQAWMPFGLGPRMCVGQRLALLVLKLALARLLQEFTITVSHKTQIPLKVVLRPFIVARNGVHIKAVRRVTTSRVSAE